MSQFSPYNVVYRGSRFLVTNLVDAKSVMTRLSERLPSDTSSEISAMIEQACAGHLSPKVAFAAFENFARALGMYEAASGSPAWKDFSSGVAQHDRWRR